MTNQEQPPASTEESLEIIRTMIAQAKGNFKDQAFYFLLWGWVVLAGSLGHYMLIKFSSVAQPELAWLVIFVGIIWSTIRGIRDSKQSRSVTYMSKIYRNIWMVFLVNYFILLFFIQKIDYYLTPIVLLLVAGSTFISGSLMRNKAFQFGAGAIWVCGIAAFLVPLPSQLLITAAAILLGYLVPGYMLKYSHKD